MAGALPSSFNVPVFGTFTATGTTPATVSDPRVFAGACFTFGLKTVGGTVGATPVPQTVTPGTGFTVAAASGDTSVYNYGVINQSAG